MPLNLETMSRLLIRYDPVDLYLEDARNLDEYEPEAKSILQGLPQCASERACLELVWNVFRAYFGPNLSGPRDKYRKLSAEIWRLAEGEGSP